MWPGVCQTSSRSLADGDRVSLVDEPLELHGGHFHVDILSVDLGKRLDEVSLGQRFGRQAMAADGRLQGLLEMGQALDVIDVGVGGNDRLAIRKWEIKLPDQFENLIGRVLKADIHQQPLGRIVDQIHIAPQPLAGLVIDLDHMGKNGFTKQHDKRRRVTRYKA